MKRRNFFKSHQVRQYQRTRFRNPYFDGKPKSSPKRWLFRILVLLIVAVGIPWLLLSVPWLRVNAISAQGLVTVSPSALEGYSWDFLNSSGKVLPGDHVWFLQEERLSAELTDTFELESVSIERKGRGLTINALERITPAIWVSGERMFFVDTNGLLVRELSNEEQTDVRALLYGESERTYALQSEVFTIFDESLTEPQNDAEVLSAGTIEVLSAFDAEIESLRITVDAYTIEEPRATWFTINIRNGFEIYVNGEGDAEQQLENLEVILQEQKDLISEIEYIDLRFGNRVYVR